VGKKLSVSLSGGGKIEKPESAPKKRGRKRFLTTVGFGIGYLEEKRPDTTIDG